MAGERERRLMQKALDEQLAPEEEAELRQRLDKDGQAAHLYDRLNRVDSMLRSAPQERAPQGMAAKIMGRLAELAERMDPRLSRISGLALAIALGLVAGVLIPVLLLIGWLVLAALVSGAGLAATMQQIVALLSVLIGLGETLLLRLQEILAANPVPSLVLIALIPISVIWLLRFAPRRRASDTP